MHMGAGGLSRQWQRAALDAGHQAATHGTLPSLSSPSPDRLAAPCLATRVGEVGAEVGRGGARARVSVHTWYMCKCRLRVKDRLQAVFVSSTASVINATMLSKVVVVRVQPAASPDVAHSANSVQSTMTSSSLPSSALMLSIIRIETERPSGQCHSSYETSTSTVASS